MTRLDLLRKIADDDATAVVNNIKPSHEDVPVKPETNKVAPKDDQKWADHLDKIDSNLLDKARILADKIKAFEKLPPGPERMSKMRQYQDWKTEYKRLAVELKEIVFNQDTGTFTTPQGPNQEKFEIKILEQAGCTYNTYINRGVYSKVYKSVYNEKPVIAKLTRSEEDKNTAMMLSVLKSSSPEEYSRHLLDVIDVKEIPYENNLYYVIITEMLVPANSHVRDLLSNLDLDSIEQYQAEGTATKKRSVENFLRSTDEVWESAVVNLLKKKFRIEEAMQAKTVAPLLKKCLFLMSNGGHYSNLIGSLRTTLLGELEDLDIGFSTVTDMTNSLVHFVTSLFQQIQIPSSTSDKNLEAGNPQWAALEAMPETKSFVQALMYFKSQGFRSIDLNRKNIMERSDTHDLVLADIGTLVSEK